MFVKVIIKSFLKKSYFIYFSIVKHFKYPNCEIYTNFIMPNVSIGVNSIIRDGCKIQKNIKIGKYTSINENTQIDSNCKSIGNYCSISHGVKIGMGSHPLHFMSTSTVFYEPYRGYTTKLLYDEFEDKGYTNIEHDVLIGANSIILAGVQIGTGAVIGAGSVVTKDVPAYAIVVGNPAKLIKYRFESDKIKKLLNSKWWEKAPNNLFNIENVEKFIKGKI